MRAPPFRFASLPLSARRALCALIALVFAAAALSCAPMRPATRVRVISPPPPQEAPLPDTGPPPAYEELPPPIENGETNAPAPSELSAMPAPGARIPAPPTSNLIALVLPLEEPAFARAAGAVRDGFLDAANAAGKGSLCMVIPHARDGVVAAFQIARAKGVRVAVGPLVRDDLRTLALANADLPWTLALNQLDESTPLPPAIYAFPLTVESDGRTLARRALANGLRSIDIVEGDSPLMKRLAASFASEWTKRGGAAPAVLRFDPAPEALTALRRTLSRDPPDAVVLAVTGDHAALVKPFIGNIVAYASGLVFERPSPAVARDLDGVRVVEIPWLLTPDAPVFANVQRRDFDSDALARLYALGRDAFRIADSFTDAPPERFDLDGATGHVSLGPGREFQREGRIGVYRDGVLAPLDSTP
ncbi:MAG TPA: penicillin-binding protein activator [Casimicrobiaceae bacterium]|nr:penicillin-binding protein activator [Casimicrobiaceae bacterium]